jgi:hypothetical protein
MKEVAQNRRRGRPLTHRDKNGRSIPVRADRDPVVKFFFEHVPRSDFDDAMQLSGDKRFHRLYDALHDDAYRNMSAGTLCRRFGISWLDLMNLWWQYNLNLGLIIMSNNLPQVMEDIAIDALSREVACPRCDGIGTLDENGLRTCPACKGAGEVRVPGDEHARRLCLKIAKLMDREAIVRVQQNFSAVAHDTEPALLQHAADDSESVVG